MKFFLIFFIVIPKFLMAQWVPTNGPYGYENTEGVPDIYRSYVLTIEKLNTELFAGIPGGVMKSVNDGFVWQRVLDVDSAFSLKVNGNDIYAGTEQGFYISSNSGNSWTQQNTGLSNICLLSFAVQNSKIFAGTRGGIYASANNGLTWSFSSIGMPTCTVNAILSHNSILYAGTNIGIYKSTDNGSTWTSANVGLPVNTHITSLSGNSTNIFAGSLGYIYTSQNSGNSWSNTANTFTFSFLSSFVCNIGTDTYVCGENNLVYKSTNNGASWNECANSFISDRVIFSDGINLYTAGLSGVHKTIDSGNTWTTHGLGGASQVNFLASNNGKLFAATTMGIFSTIDYGASWENNLTVRNLGIIVDFHVIAIQNTNVFAGALNGGVYKSIDNGITWLQVNIPPNINVTSLCFHNSTLYLGTLTGIFASSDLGTTWNNVSTGLPPVPGVFHLHSNNPVLFAGTAQGVFLTTDGINWTAANSGIPAGSNIRSITSNGANIYAAGANDIYISNNYGSSWVASNLDACGIYDIEVVGDTIYVFGNDCSNGGGAFVSFNNGATWNDINAGIEDCTILSSEIVGEKLFIGRNSCFEHPNGVFFGDISGLLNASLEEHTNMPQRIFPNPVSNEFNLITNALSINKSYKITNQLGETLMTGVLEELNNVVNISTFEDGVYFILMEEYEPVKIIKN
jgi:photosystem II stability/assembly factor-like uncharacterized protein